MTNIRLMLKKKSTVYILGIAFVLLLITGYFLFWRTSLSPSETVIAFDKAAKNGEINESKKYIGAEFLKMIEGGKAWWIGSYANLILKYNESHKKVSPLKQTGKIIGEIATIKVEVIRGDGSKRIRTYSFIKESNVWKISKFEYLW